MDRFAKIFMLCLWIAGYGASNTDTSMPDEFSPEVGISVDQNLSGAPVNIRFTPTAADKYSFYCRNKLLFFDSHRDKGMEGVLEVAQ